MCEREAMSSSGSKIKNFPDTEAAALASRASGRVVVVVERRRQLGGREDAGGEVGKGRREGGMVVGEKERAWETESSRRTVTEKDEERGRGKEKKRWRDLDSGPSCGWAAP